MGMTDEQKLARKKSAEKGNIRWIKDNCLRTKDGKDDYVFISYKSDDYKQVLDDIVYNTCKKYGLKVYFDTAFDEDSRSWIEQYYDNMSDPKCKAFIAFIDDAYYSSYATLLEMMSRKTEAAGGDYRPDSLFFLPINLGTISDIIDGSNTGLGTKRFANGKTNQNADLELQKFNEIFSEIADEDTSLKKIYKREHDYRLYEEATDQMPAYGKMYLNITQCRRIMERVIPHSNSNDGTNKDFVEVIHDKLMTAGLGSVFKKVENEAEPETEPEAEPDTISYGTISLKDFLKKYDNSSFKKSTYTKFKLTGKAGYEKYGTAFFDSAYDLVWAFVMGLISDRGKEYIDMVNAKHPGLKNPIFITQDEYGKRDDQNKYRQVSVEKANTCYMYRHYGQYQWIDAVLKARLQEYGLPLDAFYFEYVAGDEESEDTFADTGTFRYRLWGERHTADKLATMMHDVFDLIAERYPDRIEAMAKDSGITSVAAKADVDQGLLPPAKMNYFKARKEHMVGDSLYYVSTRYNREQGIGQLIRMITVCEGNADSLVIDEMPQKSQKTVYSSKSGKKDISEKTVSQ